MNKHDFGKVGVLMGGLSLERKVSLKTGNCVFDALKNQGVNAVKIDWHADCNIIDEIKKYSPDIIFIALHGLGGEDGEIQAVLNILGIPYTGSGVKASAIMMNKVFNKSLLLSNGIKSPPFVLMPKDYSADEVIEKLGFPIVIKPVADGSSFGISIVKEKKDIHLAWELANKCGSSVFAEKFIQGEQYTVGILNGKALPAIKIETPREFYDFDAKYESDTTDYICPSGLSVNMELYVQQQSLIAFQLSGGFGWGRLDGILDKVGDFYIFDVNSVPGLTKTSLVPKAAASIGISLEELVLQILATASKNGSIRDEK